MKKYITFFTVLIMSITLTAVYARSKSSLRRLNTIRVGKNKTVRGYTNITINPKSTGDVYINEIEDNKHKITGMDDGVVILNFHDENGQIESKTITIKENTRRDSNVSFGFGFGGYYPRRYYISSDPFYTPWSGWGPYCNRRYYYYW